MKTKYTFFKTFMVIMIPFMLVTVALILFSGEQKTPALRQHPEMTPNDWMAMQRLYPYGKVNPEVWLEAVNQTRQMMTDATIGATPWVFEGPTNIGGRITDIEQP
ncbi:MAG: hypothetical protein FJY10_11690, partial [Bacteroidetes bacterium]|nr:hypothetical protein [Bacteroidota bacterium]